MRGQAILLTALIIAVAVTAVLILQSVAASSPGYGGVRAAYGVFSRDVSKAVEAVASYLDYVGIVGLLNFTENAALYALPLAATQSYCTGPHAVKTSAAVAAAMRFFILNRAALGLDADVPGPLSGCNVLQAKSGRTVVAVWISKPPNGTASGTGAYLIDSGVVAPLREFRVVLPNKTYEAGYRISAVLDVSFLALSALNITKDFRISVRVLGVDSYCTAKVQCVNITVSRPYAWTARFYILNRTIYNNVVNYTIYEADFDIVNYTEYSVVYKVNVAKLAEYVVKAYVGNIPLYIPPREAPRLGNVFRSGQSWCSIENKFKAPVVLYNTTKANVKPNASHNVTLVKTATVTYWVVHAGGWLNLTNCNQQTPSAVLAANNLAWLYP